MVKHPRGLGVHASMSNLHSGLCSTCCFISVVVVVVVVSKAAGTKFLKVALPDGMGLCQPLKKILEIPELIFPERLKIFLAHVCPVRKPETELFISVNAKNVVFF